MIPKRIPIEPTQSSVEAIPVTSTDIAEQLYARAELESVLFDFAHGNPAADGNRLTSQSDIERVLKSYTDDLTQMALLGGTLNNEQLFSGFETVARHMNDIAREKLNPRPKGLLGGKRFLFKNPEDDRKVVSGFEKEDWDTQFLQDLEQLAANPEQTDDLKDFVYTAFYGFALAPFSYVQQAHRWA